MDRALADLIKISNTVGADSKLVQGGGGNTSVKTADGKYMYIKASGTSLADMSAVAGWRRLRLDAVLAILSDKSLARLGVFERETAIVNRLKASCDDNIKTDARASVESHLHALLEKCVIHLHPIAVDAYVCARKGRAVLEKLFRDEKYPPLWVAYADPGFALGTRISKSVAEYEKRYGVKPRIAFLQKHGLLVSAPSAQAAVRLVRKVVRTCENNLPKRKRRTVLRPSQDDIKAAKLVIRGAMFETTGRYVAVKHYLTKEIGEFIAERNAEIRLRGVLTPDELAYAGGPPIWLAKCDEKIIRRKLTHLISAGQRPPGGFLVNRLGLFVATEEKSQALIKDVMTLSIMVRKFAECLGGLSPLNRRQSEFIDKWESESFRRSLVAGSSSGQLNGRISVVTGAGSGLGRSIATGLAGAGAIVALVDIDIKAAAAAAADIQKQLPDAVVCPIRCDVTSVKDVDNAFDCVIEGFGGLDILVNAAGIAPAYALVELPVDKWRMTLEVNLTGYMLMAKAAARIMKRQQMGGCIINLSSKSGLEASKNNTPYNATKAAEIHMARGWAMELGQYGIRVNSVAPGNVFEGSKIWNRQYIRVCAKKYGIKPQEVIDFYINKTSLKREIKGGDVADAVVFLCSDKARTITGQTLVPDSGQVMVR